MRNKYYLTALLIVILDHLSKWAVLAHLDRSQPMELVPGYLRFSLVFNSGVAFGFFSGNASPWKPYILSAMAVVALVAIYLYSRRMPQERLLLQWSLAIITGGVLGNFIDRVFRGSVVDFIEVHVHEVFYWPNFNIADSAITIGIALLLIDTMKNPAFNETAAPQPDSQS